MQTGLLVVVSATLLGALPPPPKQVVLANHGTFGEVHFDHEAHLARRIACKTCHGPGQVRRPQLTPGAGHATCRACHVELKRGPTACRDCHRNVKTDVAKAAPPGPTATPAPTPIATATAIPVRDDGPPPSLRRTVHAGFAMIGGSSRSGPGLGLDVRLEQGHALVESEVDWGGRGDAQRALALVGGGFSVPVGSRVRARAVALCGVDTGSPAYVLPAVGARLGVELTRRRSSFLAPSADVSVAVLSALGSRLDASGRETTERAVVLSFLLGWDVPGS